MLRCGPYNGRCCRSKNEFDREDVTGLGAESGQATQVRWPTGDLGSLQHGAVFMRPSAHPRAGNLLFVGCAACWVGGPGLMGNAYNQKVA